MILALLATACVDGDGPVAPDGTRNLGLTVAPRFASTSGAAGAGELTRALLTVVSVETGDTLGVSRTEIDPNANEWVLEASFEVPEGQAEIFLLMQLLSVTDGVETSEWSGQTPAISVTAAGEAREIRQVDLYRGPPENLQVEGVELEGVLENLIEGDSARLGASVTGGGEGIRVFFLSRNPDVVSVTEEGVLRALQPGTATVLATAGPATDSAVVEVEEWPLPAQEEVEALFPGMSDGLARIVPALGDEEAAAGLESSLGEVRSALENRDGLEASRALDEARTALDDYRAESETAARDAPDLSVVELLILHLERLVTALR